MARTQYTVTFPAAKAGDQVAWPTTVKVYADKDAQVPLQPGQSLNEALTFSGWSDSASVAFSRRKTDGTTETLTVTSGAPTGTGAAVPSVNAASLTASQQSGTTYTLTLGDANTVVEMTNASAATVTVPLNSSVAFPLETIINVYSAGAGGVTVAAGAGVTIRNNSTALVQFGECSLRQRVADEWVRVG